MALNKDCSIYFTSNMYYVTTTYIYRFKVGDHESANQYGNAVQEVIVPDPDDVQKVPKRIPKKTEREQEVRGEVDDEAGDVPWEEFDEKGYIDKKRCNAGQDCYNRNKFNQLASDNTKSNRHVPDTRNAQ